ncbi:SpoIID/LytB domain-containing protein, partial [Actinotalea fermentans]|uniref:SpoIID/LytB domain-containing protein n=1 Tax=Actinotalea fermentans TaxID=43671 RepID=UPI001649B995
MRRRLAGVLTTVLAIMAVGFGPVSAPSAFAVTEEAYTPPPSGAWQVEGRGWGHGVGMSQWGAQAQALQGRTAEQILDFYYPGTARYDIGQDYPLRVRLDALAGATMTSGPVPGGSLVITDLATGASATAPPGARVEVTRSAGAFTVTTGGAPLAVGASAVVTGPVQVGGSGGSQVWAYRPDGSGTRYPGALRANPTGAATLEVVNHVPMEQYLRGVVPRESPASWGAAALQAQAIAARTYALAVRNTAATADLCDTTQCQVYGGAAVVTASGAVTERFDPRTDAAISATARIARYYGGGPAFTQFSSSNGGYSRAGSRPYLVAQPDPYTGTAPGDDVSRWTGTLSVSRVQQSCPSGGTLQRMVLTRDGRGELGGRVTQARLECTTGTATVNTPAFGLLSSWWRPTSVGQPFGNAEAIVGSSGGITVTGWAIDPDTTSPVTIRVEVDGGTAGSVLANGPRADVGAAFPAYGAAHGFDVTLPSAPRTADVCVVAVNTGAGSDSVLGCRTLTVPPGAPYGAVDAASGVPERGSSPQGISVRGWAVDPDAGTAPVAVEVRVDGTPATTVTADLSRPDVGAALPGVGDRHGYGVTVPATPGAHEVCVLAVNMPAGRNPTLGCRSVTVPGGPAVGNFEILEVVPGGVRVRGWALDPDTANPVSVWLSHGGSGEPVVADRPRTDVAAAYPEHGDRHGFDVTLSLPAGLQA